MSAQPAIIEYPTMTIVKKELDMESIIKDAYDYKDTFSIKDLENGFDELDDLRHGYSITIQYQLHITRELIDTTSCEEQAVLEITAFELRQNGEVVLLSDDHSIQLKAALEIIYPQMETVSLIPHLEENGDVTWISED